MAGEITRWTAGGVAPHSVATKPAVTNLDGWTNIITGLGLAARDKRLAASFTRNTGLTRDELESLYHDDGLICRICELPAKEMTREWIEFVDPDQKLTAKLASLNARRKVFEAIVWARLYGACVIVMIVNDGRRMDQPLNIDGVKAIDDLLVIDRHDLSIVGRYTDPSKPKFGQPELFEIRSSAVVMPNSAMHMSALHARIHESRCLVFEGTLTGRRRKIDEEGWSQSLVERVIEPVRDFISAYGGAAHLTTDFAQAVFKIKGLAQMLNSDADDKVLKRLRFLDLSRSVARAIPLDENEDFERKATPLTGLPDLLDRLAERVCAELDIPITRFLGRSAGGLNGTGEGEERQFYNTIKNEQETVLRPPLGALLRVCAQAIKFKPKDSIDGEVPFTFRPLWQPTEKEIAETRKIVADTDVAYHGIGVLDSAEIAVSRFGGDAYSMETQIDQDAPPSNSNKDPNALPDEEGDDADPEESEEDAAARAELTAKTGVPSDKTVQDTAMNGAQMKAIADMMTLVRRKEMEVDAAIEFVIMCAPGANEERIKKMFEKIKPEDPPAPPMLAPGQPGAPKPGAPGQPGAQQPPKPGQPATAPAQQQEQPPKPKPGE